MASPNRCPLVMIEWEDRVQRQSRWSYLAQLGEPEVVRCVSVGWLVADTKRSKSLAPNMRSSDEPESLQVSRLITIPSRCLIPTTKLKEPSRTR